MNAAATLPVTAASDPVRRFLIHVVLWNVALFGLIRWSWVDQHGITALVSFQQRLLAWYGATPHPGVIVTADCSGADVMALLAGFLFAYPARWSRRLAGAALGCVLLLAINAVRIGSLYTVASDPARLNVWHVYLWPAILTGVTVVFALLWIRWVDGRARAGGRWMRFGVLAGAGLLVYAAVVPWAFTSTLLHQAGVWTAAAAAFVLAPIATGVQATGTLLITGRGAFQVTQECLFTPMLPLYVAAVASVPWSWRRRLGALALMLPVFFLLGVARVLVLALPASIVESPVAVAHGFYQLMAGALVLMTAAHVSAARLGGAAATRRTLVAFVVALATSVVFGRLWTDGVLLVASGVTTITAVPDPQGAWALVPVFQVGLVAGLWVALAGWRRPGALGLGLGVLAVAQVIAVAGYEAWAASAGAAPHTLVVRAWALLVPIAIAVPWLLQQSRVRDDAGYRQFWHDVGADFPSLAGAASTRIYLEGEQRLLTQALPTLEGCSLLKTDLWDEAKNTRILQWAADQGARVFGMDLSEPILHQARSAFGPARRLRPVQSDVRRLPFADGSFDAIYSMGTVEHFDETAESVVELARILRPGGRLILGVPNRRDPFLRPALVAAMHAVGLYGYGFEKSYTRRGLRRLLEDAGLEVRMESGILFMPGWLRMLDLWCHTRARPLAVVTGWLLWPFAWLERHAPFVHRHGYLIASVGEKPAAPRATAAASADNPRLETTPLAPSAPMTGPGSTGVEQVVDARGCDPEALRSLPRLQELVGAILSDLSLHPLAPPVWHVFAGQGGITGMVLLAESHLTVHTYPEAGLAAINLYCCRPHAVWPWEARLAAALGATDVRVRALARPERSRTS